jgi:hypothetical protein
MRARALAWLSLAGFATVSLADEVVSIPLTPDPRILAHMATVDPHPERDLAVPVRKSDGSRVRNQAVQAAGPIADEDVRAIVDSALSLSSAYWDERTQWRVAVVGDSRYAFVQVSMGCGLLCGFSAKYTYAFQDGRWNYLSTSDQLYS